MLPSCVESEWDFEMDPQGTSGTNPGDRVTNNDRRKVLLLYSSGYNDLQGYLKEDIQDLLKGWAPGLSRNNDVLLVYSHLSRTRSDLVTFDCSLMVVEPSPGAAHQLEPFSYVQSSQ